MIWWWEFWFRLWLPPRHVHASVVRKDGNVVYVEFKVK